MKNETNMLKRNFTLIAAAAGICLAGCQDESPVEKNNDGAAAKANAVSFAAAGIGEFDVNEEDPESRTAFGNGTTTPDGKWNCPIYWEYGDKVRVYCEQASEPAAKAANYEVVWSDYTEGDTQRTGSLRNADGTPLCWGNGGQEHTFYAFYPASAAEGNTANGKVTAEVPKEQSITEWKQDPTTKKWTGTPDMDRAYMRAAATVGPDSVGNPVTLRFSPITTALQISLRASDKLTGAAAGLENGKACITAVYITAETDGGNKQPLCGEFELDLATGETTYKENPQYVDLSTVTVNMRNADGSFFELGAGETADFTVFLLPGAKEDPADRTIDNLTIEVAGFGVGGSWTARWTGAGIRPGTVNHLTLNDYVTNPGTNTWMAALDDNVPLSQLSLPGSVNAFTRDIMYSYAYTPGTEMDVTQWYRAYPNEATEPSQFRLGVRAFEVSTNVESKTGGFDGWGYDKKLMLTAGTNDSGAGYDLMYVVNNLSSALSENPSEFAVVIPYFDQGETTTSVATWMQTLSYYINRFQTISGIAEVIPFDPTLTVGEARGKIVLMARYANTYDDLVGEFTSASDHSDMTFTDILSHISYVNEWDTEKDRWYRRGYDTSNAGVNFYQNTWYVLSAAKNQYAWMGNDDPGTGEYNLDNWKWDMAISSAGTAAAPIYVYEWERTCMETGTYSHDRVNLGGRDTDWNNSIDEKIDGVTRFADDAMRILKDPDNKTAFINSLRGYAIVKNGELSGQSWNSLGTSTAFGRHGDIPPYAQAINNAMHEHINGKSYSERGPLGIVLMDYAGVSQIPAASGVMYGDLLLQDIIDNNFRFPLSKAGGAE